MAVRLVHDWSDNTNIGLVGVNSAYFTERGRLPMCSVSISEQETEQIDTVIVTIVSKTAVETVRTSGILTTYMTDNRDRSRKGKHNATHQWK